MWGVTHRLGGFRQNNIYPCGLQQIADHLSGKILYAQRILKPLSRFHISHFVTAILLPSTVRTASSNDSVFM